MKGSVKLFKLFGIEIRIHITFLLLPLIFGLIYGVQHGFMMGMRAVVFIFFVFICVTVHEICHSLVAKRYKVKVKDITLLPIGGIASMQSIPENPKQEFAISIAGPAFNLIFAAIIFYPIYLIIGDDILRPGLETWRQTLAYMFWINPILAVFNLLPAFPMDGGRILRSILAQKIEYGQATKIAVSLGHTFAFIFGFLGIISFNPMLLLIAVFIYMVASQEGFLVDLRLTLKQFRVRDILPEKFCVIEPHTPVSKILELIFHTHQEDFPVVEDSKLVGLVSRADIISCVHQSGLQREAREFMRTDFETVKPEDRLSKIYMLMQQLGLKALPVLSGGQLKGIVSLEDISRVYSLLSHK